MSTSTIFRMSMMALAIFFTSCDPEDGIDGIDGIAGVAGTDGNDGEQGPAGEDGNANVRTFTFDISQTMTEFHFTLPFNELSQDVLDNDVILTYIQSASNLRYYPIPGISDDNEFEVELYLENMTIYSYDRLTGASLPITAGQFTLVKTIIIESFSTTTGKSADKDVLSEIKAAGININDYYEVADYYGIDY